VECRNDRLRSFSVRIQPSAKPAVEDLEDLVVGGGGAGLAAGQQVAQERLEVAAGGRLQAGATLAQEGVGLPHGDEIGGDGAGRAVLGVQVPLQGADEGVRAERVHEREGKQGKRSPSGTRPAVSSSDDELTSVPLVRGLLVGATGGTAVLTAVLPVALNRRPARETLS
jgi:hypothetical protein